MIPSKHKTSSVSKPISKHKTVVVDDQTSLFCCEDCDLSINSAGYNAQVFQHYQLNARRPVDKQKKELLFYCARHQSRHSEFKITPTATMKTIGVDPREFDVERKQFTEELAALVLTDDEEELSINIPAKTSSTASGNKKRKTGAVNSAASSLVNVLLTRNQLVGIKLFLLVQNIPESYLESIKVQPKFSLIDSQPIPLCFRCESLPIKPCFILDTEQSFTPRLFCAGCCTPEEFSKHDRINAVDAITSLIKGLEVQCNLCNTVVAIGHEDENLLDHLLNQCSKLLYCSTCDGSFALSQFTLHLNECNRVTCIYTAKQLLQQFPTNTVWCNWRGSSKDAPAHKEQCPGRLALYRIFDDQPSSISSTNVMNDTTESNFQSSVVAAAEPEPVEIELDIETKYDTDVNLIIPQSVTLSGCITPTPIKTKQSFYTDSHVHVIVSHGCAVRFKLVEDSFMLFVSLRDLASVAQSLRFTSFTLTEALTIARRCLRDRMNDYLSTDTLPTCVNVSRLLSDVRLDNTKCEQANILVSKNIIIDLIQMYRAPLNPAAQQFAIYLEKIILPLIQPDYSYKTALKRQEMIVLISRTASAQELCAKCKVKIADDPFIVCDYKDCQGKFHLNCTQDCSDDINDTSQQFKCSHCQFCFITWM